MSETEVSQLERAPDSLRSAVDPALEETHQHQDHVQHHHHNHYPDPDPDMQHLVQQVNAEHMQHQEMIEDMSSPDHQEPFSPRRGYTHKRNEEPPRNVQGKMTCKFTSTCPGITFERRCEWSKHMDKHDRPYKCAEPGCEKLQGFTYSGGLLRHQREVHKMHGGTKKALYCPIVTCKRHTGSGFTRKENLSEHMRRVHRRGTDGADPAAQAQDGLAQLEAAASHDYDGLEDDSERSAKRKRLDPQLVNGDHDFDLDLDSGSMKKLKDENQELKDRMKQMEEDMQQQRRLLEDILARQIPPAPTAPMAPMS